MRTSVSVLRVRILLRIKYVVRGDPGDVSRGAAVVRWASTHDAATAHAQLRHSRVPGTIRRQLSLLQLWWSEVEACMRHGSVSKWRLAKPGKWRHV